MVKTILVNIKGDKVLATPDTPIVERNGEKRFWFFHDGKKRLAVQGKSGMWTAMWAV